MAKKSSVCASYDSLPMILRSLLVVFLGPIVGAIYRLLNGKLLMGIIWLLTGGLFVIGWIIDIVTTVTKGKFTFLV